jgi:hypothetical protein
VGTVASTCAIAQRSGRSLHQRDVVLPVVARLVLTAKALVDGNDDVPRHVVLGDAVSNGNEPAAQRDVLWPVRSGGH